MDVKELIDTLRTAGNYDRNPATGSGPLTFCIEAADALEELGQENTALKQVLESEIVGTRWEYNVADNGEVLAEDLGWMDEPNPTFDPPLKPSEKIVRRRPAGPWVGGTE